MRIAVLKETKQHEYRVGMTPTCVATYVEHGHQVLVETGAGLGTGFSDQDYQAAGASIAKDATSAAAETDMIVKVKEPSAAEVAMMHPGQILYTYLHLAALPELTQQLRKAGVVAIAYETIATPDGALPCLKPMSEIAGRLSVQEGAKYLEAPIWWTRGVVGWRPGNSPRYGGHYRRRNCWHECGKNCQRHGGRRYYFGCEYRSLGLPR